MGIPTWRGKHEKRVGNRLKILRERQRIKALRNAGTLGQVGRERRTEASQEGPVRVSQDPSDPTVKQWVDTKETRAEVGIMLLPGKAWVGTHPVREGSGSSPASPPDTAPSGQAPASPTPPE